MSITVTNLTCEYRINPLGIDVPQPRLAWQLESDRRATLQTSFRIQVREAEAGYETPYWDSGWRAGDASIQLAYEGPELKARTRYAYRIKAADNYERESEWSEESWWEMGLLAPEDWQAQWISPDPAGIDPLSEPAFLLRKTFGIGPGGIKSARLYATSAGVYDVYINGVRVGDELMAPGWTSYHKRLQVQTYDVTGYVREGGNGLGLRLANGWYKGRLAWEDKRDHYGDRRAALLQLHVEMEDGTEHIVATDPGWKASTGGILFSEIYDGEIYDARLEPEGWSEAGFDDTAWHGSVAYTPQVGQLVAQENWPTRVTETLQPVSLIRTPTGESVLDFGQNMVGRVRLTLDVPAGTQITLQHAEILDQQGNFYIGNLRSAQQKLIYTAKGGGPESYAAAFTFYGFRYVKVEGYPDQDRQDIPLDAFTGEVMHSDMEPAGQFDCSHPLINQLHSNISWGQRGNFLDVPTDCPQRDERLGWTGDAQVFIRTAAFHYQVGPFFTKWLRDLQADQLPDGGVPFVIPDILGGKHSSSAWGDAVVVCPWTMYVCYGDRRLLAEQYDGMKAWVGYIHAQGSDEYLWNTGFHFGDWLGLDAKEGSYVGATPRDLIATAFYAYSTRLVRDAAVVLGRADDVRTYGELLGRIVRRFQDEFITPTGRLAVPTQTAHVLALHFDLVEGQVRERVARDLNQLVVDSSYHLTTGFVGTPYLCFALSDNGYHDTAMQLLLQESYPSWLYSIHQGATTIWEHWDGVKPDGSFWSDRMNSYNHYAYGAIGDWMYRRVAGLDMDESKAAYKRLRIRPRLDSNGLTHAEASLIGPYGRMQAGWRVSEGKAEVQVTVPVNATADIRLPAAAAEDIEESGRRAADAPGVQEIAAESGGVRLSVGSGTYRFVFPYRAEQAEGAELSEG
ncbi:alpha-L-rhamnosidase [Paenibacillus puerhi]|uniref:alpha-L-rhamnosidase n=1 Tax=Paenibacillus puerhi TaxID=2692622 RepID=UPI0013572FCC|nr:alpha-L-rhamnosidase [Paenibacillus puerhi]